MRIINQMPFTECEKCRKCVLNVNDGNDSTGERTVYIGCKNAKKCIRKKWKHNASEE